MKSKCEIIRLWDRRIDEEHERLLIHKKEHGRIREYFYRPFILVCGDERAYEPTYAHITMDGQLVCETVLSKDRPATIDALKLCVRIYPFIRFKITRYSKAGVSSSFEDEVSERDVDRSQVKFSLPSPKYRSGTEINYAQHLSMLYRSGHIKWFAHESFRLRMARNSYYIPDFMIVNADGSLQVHEVKGHDKPVGQLKLKVCSELHPYLRFTKVRAYRKSWRYEDY